MAATTPRKKSSDLLLLSCRCCNTKLGDYSIYLFGEKSAKQEIVETITALTGIVVNKEDQLPQYICRSCAGKIGTVKKKVNELKALCQDSDNKQRKELEGARTKRGRRDESGERAAHTGPNSPSASIAKPAKKIPATTDSCAKRSLVHCFQNIAPKPTVVVPSTVLQQTRTRVLPSSMTSSSVSKKQAEKPKLEEIQILSTSGLQAMKEKAESTPCLNSTQKNKLLEEIVKGSPKYFAKTIMEIPALKNCVCQLMLEKINEQCVELCSKNKEKCSVLRVSKADQKNLSEFNWVSILREMKQRAPDVLNILATIALPRLKEDASQVPPLCTAFAVLMNTRSRELSLVQKINTVILGSGNATKKTFQRFNKHGITQSRDSFRSTMDDIGSGLIEDIKKLVQTEGKPRIVFDNLDFKILANIVLPNHRNSDMHWMAQFLTFERVRSEHLDDTKPQVADVKSFQNKEYLISQSELEQIQSNYCTIVARVLVDFFPSLHHLKSAVVQHIPHRYSDEMSKKSCIVGLPIVPYNQSKHSDVCQYLEYLENFLFDIFKPDDAQSCKTCDEKLKMKESVLKEIKVPLCGDLLGRERVTGAKKTRMGCDNSTERFENIVESAALWHTKQSFLAYTWEQLYKPDPVSGREVGTLYNLRQQFSLSNVKKNVKQNYKSAEHLMLSTTKAYLCCAFMQWAGFDNLDGAPPEHIKIPPIHAKKEEKEQFVSKTIGDFVTQVVLTEFDIEKLQRQAAENRRKEQLQPTDGQDGCIPEKKFSEGQIVVMVQPKDEAQDYHYIGMGKIKTTTSSANNNNVQLEVLAIAPAASSLVKVGQVVLWPIPNIAIPKQHSSSQPPIAQVPTQQDRLMNYASTVMQLGVMLMQLNDTEKEGDGERCLINWKLLLLYFRARSRGAKYAFEAMRLITCAKALMSERMAHRIIHGQFINSKGGTGNNYANDLKMETLVKDHKVVLKGLCGNKTLKAVQRSTSAAYGLHNIVAAVDKESNVTLDSTKHTHASSNKLVVEMVTVLKKVHPFEAQPGRQLKSFPKITKCPLHNLDINKFHQWLTRNKTRLFADAFAAIDEPDDSDEEEMEEEELIDSESDNEDGVFVI